jgi:hypothetical protein
MPFNIVFSTSGDSTVGWISVSRNPDTEEVALTKRSDKVMERVASFVTKGLGSAIADDTSSRVELEASWRGWGSSKILVVVVASFGVDVVDGMGTEVTTSNLAGVELCGVTDDISSKSESFDA